MLDRLKNSIDFIKNFRIITFTIVLLLNFVCIVYPPFEKILDSLIIQYNVDGYLDIINGVAILCFVIFEVFVIAFWVFLFINECINLLEKKYEVLQDIFSIDPLNSNKIYHGSRVQALVAFQWLISILLLINIINPEKLVVFITVTLPNSDLLILLICISFMHILEGIFLSLSSVINKFFNINNIT